MCLWGAEKEGRREGWCVCVCNVYVKEGWSGLSGP